jgi:Rhodanase C-terminal
MGDQVGDVYQLKGGIERYLKAFPDGGMWRGKNFVFDKREAVGVDCPDGDGGVVRKKAKSEKCGVDDDDDNNDNNRATAKCCICDKAWDRYIGKKKCVTCGVPVLVCDSCMTQKPDKTPGMELKMRCPLCVEEGITVLASQIEFTNNGIKGKRRHDAVTEKPVSLSRTTTGGGNDNDSELNHNDDSNKSSKAAGSVLKWGGGHAQQKKQRKKMNRTPCRFGSECIRKDCFFFHPDRHGHE